MDFQGFPSDALRFFELLAENNNKAWFEEHRDAYIEVIQRPAVEFVLAVGVRLKEFVPGVQVDTSVNGSGVLLRMNRDTRFSKDKSPYKTNISGIFREGAGKKMETPGFGFQISAEDMRVMAGMFGFDKTTLDAYRQAVDTDASGKALVKAADQVRKNGKYIINGQEYKKVPRGYDAEHPRAELLKYSGLWASPPGGIPLSLVTTPDLVDATVTHFKNMLPIEQWLSKWL